MQRAVHSPERKKNEVDTIEKSETWVSMTKHTVWLELFVAADTMVCEKLRPSLLACSLTYSLACLLASFSAHGYTAPSRLPDT